jgi:hypothetical protein
MTDTSRRSFLAASAAVPLTAAAPRLATAGEGPRVQEDLEKYFGFGIKRAGGPGDLASGAWLQAELERSGYTVERLDISVPFFEPQRATLSSGAATAPVWPQPIVIPTGDAGVTGPLVRVDADGQSEAPLAGAIALVDLPFARWSTSIAKPVKTPIAAAFAAGAKAAVVITNGPTGRIIALNADGRKPSFAGPVALLAPADAKPFLAAAMRRDSATLHIVGAGGRRPAFNFAGRIDRGKQRWLAISTPRSGWYGCAGERGSGIAVWLHLARWASERVRDYNLSFICNSGHEYEYLGATETLKAIAPKPADTHFWLHLGANVAARDWQEWPGKWLPLPSVDTQRFLAISPALLPLARQAFAGHPGLEAPYSSAVLSGGELDEIIAAGYQSVAGVFGIHRYHHVAGDDMTCVSAASVATTSVAFQRLVEGVVSGRGQG